VGIATPAAESIRPDYRTLQLPVVHHQPSADQNERGTGSSSRPPAFSPLCHHGLHDRSRSQSSLACRLGLNHKPLRAKGAAPGRRRVELGVAKSRILPLPKLTVQRTLRKGGTIQRPRATPNGQTENDIVRSRLTKAHCPPIDRPIVVKRGMTLSSRPCPLAAMLRPQFGLAFVRPDRLARFGGLCHLRLPSGSGRREF
jgi:hypothetical protein